jgi:3-(3-hydroxy-phenyl)propionate hydroxylase
MDEPRKRHAGMMSGLDIRYGLADGHPLLGRRMPDLDLVLPDGGVRVFALLHEARPLLINFGGLGTIDSTGWPDRIQRIDATYNGAWELPVLGTVPTPAAVLVRPDGYVAWVGERTQVGLTEALTKWFGVTVA